jgi:glycosyltransferase involved in cell wall biosynthesis
VQETVNSLKELGHKVTVICKKGEDQKEKETLNKIAYLRLNLPKNSIEKNIWLLLHLEKITSKIIIEKGIDLVWQRNRIFGSQGIIAGRKVGVKTLLEMNEPVEMSERSVFFPLIKNWFFYSAKFADKVTGTHARMFKGIPIKKQVLIHYGSNPKIFNPKNTDGATAKKYGLKGKTLFFGTSLQEWHCVKKALLAFAEVQKEFPEAAFILTGEGGRKDELKEFAKAQGIRRVFFVGNVDYKKMPHYINASDVCAALYDRNYPPIKKFDYFYSPIKVFDAMACGKPVIASGIGNIKEVIKNGKNGFLVNEQTVSEISDAMLKVFRLSKKEKEIISKLNTEKVEKEYNWKNVTKKILNNLKGSGADE